MAIVYTSMLLADTVWNEGSQKQVIRLENTPPVAILLHSKTEIAHMKWIN